jgi:glycosyltransferase involved in cell wall biosynthesis
MKIVHLISTGGIAGAEKYLVEFTSQSQKYIENIVIVLFEGECKNAKEYEAMFAKHNIKTYFFRKSFIRSLDLCCIKSIHVICEQENADIIHSHLIKSDIISFLMRKLFNSKIISVSTKHGYNEADFVSYVYYKKIHKYLIKYLYRIVEKSIHASFGVSNFISNMYYDLGISKKLMPVIHHGITTDNKIGDRYSDNKVSTNSIICVGRLAEVKGHSYLISAMEKVVKSIPDATLSIYGNGPLYTRYQQKITLLGLEKNICLKGFCFDLEKEYLKAKIAVIPSLCESFGLVFLEAFMHKVPVIAFDVPAGNELIENNVTGLLSKVLDAEDLADKIITLLRNDSLRTNIANSAYTKVITDYSMNRVVEETIRFYNKVLH